jgi:uncharacterized cupin superfamily protein
VQRVNVFTAELQRDDDDPPGYEAGYLTVGPLIGAHKLGATIYSLGPGQSNCPYHYEYPDEEWLLVLEGTLTVRTPAGEEEVGAGEAVCFREGPDGAHKLTNRSERPVRLIMFSTKINPGVAVYPDSDKIGVWPVPGGGPDKIMVRRSSDVDYWEGELPG